MFAADQGSAGDREEHRQIANEIYENHRKRELRMFLGRQVAVARRSVEIAQANYAARLAELQRVPKTMGERSEQAKNLPLLQRAGYAARGRAIKEKEVEAARKSVEAALKNLEIMAISYRRSPGWDRFYDNVPKMTDAYMYQTYIQTLDLDPETSPRYLQIRNHFRLSKAPALSNHLVRPQDGGMYSQAARGLYGDVNPSNNTAGGTQLLGTAPSAHFAPSQFARLSHERFSTTWPDW